MKKILIIVVSLLVISALGIAAFAMISEFEGEPAQENALITESEPKIVSFKACKEEITDFKLSASSFADVCSKFDKIIAENDIIEFENNHYIDTFMLHQSDIEYKSEASSSKVTNFTVSTKEDADTLKYLMLLSCLDLEPDSESVVWIQYRYDPFSSNCHIPNMLFVSNDYEEFGYKNALEYENAVIKDEAELGDDSYYVFFDKKYIFNANSNGLTNLWNN